MKVTFFNGSTSTSVTTAPQIIGVGAALPAGQEGQVLGYGPGGVPRALDAAGPPYDDTGIKQRVQTLESTVAGKADVGHGHAVSAITGLQGILDGKAAVGHQHDLAAVSGLQAALDGKASATHTHGIAGVTGLQGALDGKAATTHTHGIAGVTGLQSALDGKAAAMHGHAIAEVTGLQTALDGKAAASAIPTTEFLQDLIAAMFQGGTHTNASISYDDNAGTLNITAVGGTGGGSSLSQEEVEDFVGRLVVQGAGIAVTYDDAGNVLRIALSGESFTTAEKNKLGAIASGATANATDAHLLNRANHTGVQAIATVTGLQAALDGKAAAGHAHDIASVAGLQAVIDALTARIVALENGAVVTPPDPQPQPDPSPYQPDMTTGRIAPITTSFGGRPNVTPATYYFDGQDEMAAMAMGA